VYDSLAVGGSYSYWIEVKIFVVCSFPDGFEEEQCVSVTLEEEAETDWERPDIIEY
jgi:hypothetical protein